MNYSYAMEVKDNIFELEKDGFIIEMDDGDYTVSFPKGKEEIWEQYIIENLSNEYWNEYIGNRIVYFFKFKDGSIKRYVLDNKNSEEILKLCCEFAETSFDSVESMILGNDFYKANVIENELAKLISGNSKAE